MAAVRLEVRVIPRAKRTGIAGRRGGALLVRLAAPPVEGAANEALRAFLAERLGVPQRQVTIVRGATSRDKTIAIDGVDVAAITRALEPDS